MSNSVQISIVSPVYGAEGIVGELVRRITEEIEKITSSYEIILVEDASPDRSWEKIKECGENFPKLKGVKLSRNFGQHNAISAGMELARGEYVILMDCDLQHDPKYFKELYNKIGEGYDLVYTKTSRRRHGPIKNFFANVFYSLFAFLQEHKMDPGVGSYSILSRKVVDAYNQYNDYRKAYLWALAWAGFDSAVITIEHNARLEGKSSYSVTRLVRHALNVAVANSNRLLYISIFLGLFFSFLAFLGLIVVIFRYLVDGALEGWSSLMVTIVFFSGMILTALGIIGIYLGKVFEQTKNRPRYLITKTVNFDHDGQ